VLIRFVTWPASLMSKSWPETRVRSKLIEKGSCSCEAELEGLMVRPGPELFADVGGEGGCELPDRVASAYERLNVGLFLHTVFHTN
jgi:hypothetical protein